MQTTAGYVAYVEKATTPNAPIHCCCCCCCCASVSVEPNFGCISTWSILSEPPPTLCCFNESKTEDRRQTQAKTAAVGRVVYAPQDSVRTLRARWPRQRLSSLADLQQSSTYSKLYPSLFLCLARCRISFQSVTGN